MTIQLDHLLVPSRNKVAAAKLLAELLGVPWSETGERSECELETLPPNFSLGGHDEVKHARGTNPFQSQSGVRR
jgi:hypothetical protein